MGARVLLTGGAGYIGSHTYLALRNAGHHPVILDDFSNASDRVIPRLGAWVSEQSRPMSSRASLVAAVAKARLTKGGNPERPPHWGGYRIRPVEMEFWKDGAFRLHDRERWRRDAGGLWSYQRLYP